MYVCQKIKCNLFGIFFTLNLTGNMKRNEKKEINREKKRIRKDTDHQIEKKE